MNIIQKIMMNLSLISLVYLTACTTLPISHNQNKKTQEISVHIFTEKDMNLDILDVPSPAKIYFLQLSSLIEFEQLTEPHLNEEDENVQNLKKIIVEQNQFMVRPKQIINFKLMPNDKMRYLGIMVAYRDISKVWKLSLIKQEPKWFNVNHGNYLYLQLDANGITQLSQDQAIRKIANKQLQEVGEEFEDMTEETKEKVLSKIEHILKKQQSPKVNLEKGVFIESSIQP